MKRASRPLKRIFGRWPALGRKESRFHASQHPGSEFDAAAPARAVIMPCRRIHLPTCDDFDSWRCEEEMLAPAISLHLA